MDYRTSARASAPALVFRSPWPWHIALVALAFALGATSFGVYTLRRVTVACSRSGGAGDATCHVTTTFFGIPLAPSRTLDVDSARFVVVSTSKNGSQGYALRPDGRAQDDIPVWGGARHVGEIEPEVYAFFSDTGRRSMRVDTVTPAGGKAVGWCSAVGIWAIGVVGGFLLMRTRWSRATLTFRGGQELHIRQKDWLRPALTSEVPLNEGFTFVPFDHPLPKGRVYGVALRGGGASRRLFTTLGRVEARRAADELNGLRARASDNEVVRSG
jgi:hypothetical protein